MSCTNSTAPLDIDRNKEQICDLKCEYIHNYLTSSNLIITNRKEYLSVRVDNNINNPVTFNSNKYNLSEIRLYNRSIHSWNGTHTEGEIIMVHNNILGNQGDLLVCIPIKKGYVNSDILKDIILESTKRANSINNRTTLSIDNLNLNNLIPSKPYYFYKGSLAYVPCNSLVNYIVFDENDSIYISDSIYDKFNKLIIQNNYKTKKNVDNIIYYNINGSKIEMKDEIYIDCQPTGYSDIDNVGTNNKFPLTLSMSNLNGPYLNIIIGALLMVGIIKLSKKLLN